MAHLNDTWRASLPQPLLPRFRGSVDFMLLELDPLEIARQITCMDHALFQGIRADNCFTKVYKAESEKDPVRLKRQSNGIAVAL